MSLKKLTPQSIQNMIYDKNSKIYLIDFTEKYLEELLKKYDLAKYLAGILLDEENRIAGEMKCGRYSIPFCDIELPLFPYQCLSELSENSFFIILNDYFEEIYNKLLKWNVKRKNNCFNIYYYVNHETEVDLYYRERYKTTPLKNLILFRSGPHASSYVKGMDFADNARALFEYMLAEHFNETYELVWLVKNPSDFLDIAEKYENVRFISFDWLVSEVKEEREKYYEALCLAKYIFMTDAYGFARNARKDQIRIQLWHGCGFKTRVNFSRCENRYEYTTVISELYSRIHQDIYGLREDQVLVTGYAKEDWLFHPAKEAWKILSISDADKYIFWLPTFRIAKTGLNQLNEYEIEGQTGLPVVDTFEKLEILDKLLKDMNMVLVVKLHPFQEQSRILKISMKHIVMLDNEFLVDQDIQINQLLGLSDGLISDYSSVAVDYMLLDKPIGFTLEDVEEYEASRGFVFDNIREWLPGAELFTFCDFCSFIREIGLGIDSTKNRRRELKNIMHKYNDDQSCKRIVEALQIKC